MQVVRVCPPAAAPMGACASLGLAPGFGCTWKGQIVECIRCKRHKVPRRARPSSPLYTSLASNCTLKTSIDEAILKAMRELREHKPARGPLGIARAARTTARHGGAGVSACLVCVVEFTLGSYGKTASSRFRYMRAHTGTF